MHRWVGGIIRPFVGQWRLSSDAAPTTKHRVTWSADMIVASPVRVGALSRAGFRQLTARVLVIGMRPQVRVLRGTRGERHNLLTVGGSVGDLQRLDADCRHFLHRLRRDCPR